MKQTLDTFYKSKEWVSLVGAIRLQRINAQGDLVCEYCGEPVVRAYDCIGHHVIELNDNNVNDAMIALNPDNIQLVHHKCHNRYIRNSAMAKTCGRFFWCMDHRCQARRAG